MAFGVRCSGCLLLLGVVLLGVLGVLAACLCLVAWLGCVSLIGERLSRPFISSFSQLTHRMRNSCHRVIGEFHEVGLGEYGYGSEGGV
jgi:hypothetical protein